MKKIDLAEDKFSVAKTLQEDDTSSIFDDSFFNDDDDDDFNDDDSTILEDNAQSEDQPNISASENPKNNAANIAHNSLQTQPEQAPLTGKSFADNIEFRLGCEIGQVVIAFDKLKNLTTGSVLNFNNTLQTLFLTLNNVRIGEGVLVDIDGKIGVKITKWYNRI